MRTLTRTTTEERRRLPLSTADVAIRADEGVTGGERFTGYAAVFNSRTAIGNPLRWGFYEEIAPGAFTKTLSEGDARMLIDHDSYYVVSRVSAGSLLLAEDARGLAVDSALDTGLSYVSDLKANVRNKNITGMSFGFYVIKDDWTLEQVETSDGQTADVEVRRILEARLIEVSAVTFPAYEETEAELASVASALVSRGDQAAIEQRATFRPELRDLLQLVGAGGASDGGTITAGPEEAGQRAQDAAAAEARGGLPVHSTDTSDAAWDGPANSSDLPQDESALRMAHAWVDPDGDANAKGSYRFIHHFVGVDGDVGAASTVACTTAIGVLNGARGGTTIPEEDRQAVYKHLARHLKDAGIKAPELKQVEGEPGESTRETSTPQSAPAAPSGTEPAETTRTDQDARALRMRGLAARYGLQLTL